MGESAADQIVTTTAAYLAFAAGFAAGNYIGLKLKERLAYGLLSVTIITRRDASTMIAYLKEKRRTQAAGADGVTTLLCGMSEGGRCLCNQ